MNGKQDEQASQVFLTPPEVAKRLRASNQKVLGWIRRAELRAVNVGNGSRPRYRISPDSLAYFLESREVPAPSPPVRQRRRMPPGGPLDPALGEELLKKRKARKIGNQYFRVWDGITLFF